MRPGQQFKFAIDGGKYYMLSERYPWKDDGNGNINNVFNADAKQIQPSPRIDLPGSEGSSAYWSYTSRTIYSKHSAYGKQKDDYRAKLIEDDDQNGSVNIDLADVEVDLNGDNIADGLHKI